MRIFMRIVFALIVAMGLGLVIVQANAKAFDQKVNELGQIALKEKNYGFFVSERYYMEEPLLEDVWHVGTSTYRLFVYHVAAVRYEALTPVIVQGFQIFLEKISGPGIMVPYQGVIRTVNDERTLTFYAFQIADLPVYAMLDMENDSSFYNEEDLTIEGIFQETSAFDIVKNGEVIASYPLHIKQNDLLLKSRLSAYILLHGDVPKHNTDDIFMTSAFTFDSRSLVIRDSVIYLVVVGVLFYGFFVYQKKRLGRRDATEGLKKDIEKLKERPDEKR